MREPAGSPSSRAGSVPASSPSTATTTVPVTPASTATTTSDVLVVGLGIIGAVAAWRALRAGLTVTCLDPAPGSGATYAAAGMLAPVTEASFGEDALTRLCVASAARWSGFAADLEDATGLATGWQACGTLAVAYDQADAAQGRRLAELHRALGLASEELTVSEARIQEPFLGGRLSGAYRVAGDHQVDPRATHAALLAALAAPGSRGSATVVRERAARLLRSPSGAVVGAVDEAGGTHHAGLVVLAAGAASGTLLDDVPEVPLPTRPVMGETIRLDARGTGFGLRHVVRGTVQMRPVYVVPRPGGEVVVGATSEERHDDRVPTAGGVHALLRDARALVPGIDELAFREVTARARPGTPDNLPIIGSTAVPGLAVATGHYRNGVLLTPLTADLLDDLFTGSATPPPASVDPRRFDLAGALR